MDNTTLVIYIILSVLTLIYFIVLLALIFSISSKLGDIREESRRHSLMLSKLLQYVSDMRA